MRGLPGNTGPPPRNDLRRVRRGMSLGCTIIGVKTKAGVLIASNSDDPYDTRTRLVARTPPGGYRYIGTEIVTPDPDLPWANMLTRGINERGLAFTWTYVEPNDGTYLDVQWKSLREFLEGVISTAGTVHDVEELIFEKPRAFHGNFLFGDAQGNMALWEVSTKDARKVMESPVCRTNAYLTSEMKHCTTPSSIDESHSTERFTTCTARLKSLGVLDRSALGKVLQNHDGRVSPETTTWGHSVCNHGKSFGTVSSEILDPSARTFWYAYGWPCGETGASAEQPYQDRSWGQYVSFGLSSVPDGEIVSIEGIILL